MLAFNDTFTDLLNIPEAFKDVLQDAFNGH